MLKEIWWKCNKNCSFSHWSSISWWELCYHGYPVRQTISLLYREADTTVLYVYTLYRQEVYRILGNIQLRCDILHHAETVSGKAYDIKENKIRVNKVMNIQMCKIMNIQIFYTYIMNIHMQFQCYPV